MEVPMPKSKSPIFYCYVIASTKSEEAFIWIDGVLYSLLRNGQVDEWTELHYTMQYNANERSYIIQCNTMQMSFKVPFSQVQKCKLMSDWHSEIPIEVIYELNAVWMSWRGGGWVATLMVHTESSVRVRWDFIGSQGSVFDDWRQQTGLWLCERPAELLCHVNEDVNGACRKTLLLSTTQRQIGLCMHKDVKIAAIEVHKRRIWHRLT